MFQLNYQSHKSIYEQIVDNIKEQIMTGVLKENTPLPTVRELSQLLTINPHTVQKAFQTLDQEGYIYTIKNKGIFVSSIKHVKRDEEKAKAIINTIVESYKELIYMGMSQEEIHNKILEKMKGDLMIKVKDLYKVIDDEVVLDHLNMQVEEGSIYGLIGPNGAGKTTLIRHLVGVLKQDSGKIFIESQPIYENIELKRKIGYISDAMYFIETNLIRNANVYKELYPSWNQDRFEELYKTFKLSPTKKIQTFSKGMRKQASFCLIMSTMPDYLILDEPIDGLDPIARKLVWKYIIDDVAQRNLTVLISSHNLKELEGIVDHVGILYKGKIMREFDLEYIQTHIHKIQVSFGDKEVNLDPLNIVYQEERGSVKILIIEDSLLNIRKVIGEQSPLIFDILPLSLEELFMYEVGGEDDDIQKLIF